jgi:hypothetical protein
MLSHKCEASPLVEVLEAAALTASRYDGEAQLAYRTTEEIQASKKTKSPELTTTDTAITLDEVSVEQNNDD